MENIDFIEFGKEKDATEAQLRRIFGGRFKNNKEFLPRWVTDRGTNPLENNMFILSKKGNNKEYQFMRCNWSRTGLSKMQTHMAVREYDLQFINEEIFINNLQFLINTFHFTIRVVTTAVLFFLKNCEIPLPKPENRVEPILPLSVLLKQ
jgi:hypothetical protein